MEPSQKRNDSDDSNSSPEEQSDREEESPPPQHRPSTAQIVANWRRPSPPDREAPSSTCQKRHHHHHPHHHQQRYQLQHDHHPSRGSEEASKHVSLPQSLHFIFLHNFNGLSKKAESCEGMQDDIVFSIHNVCHIFFIYLLNHWCVNLSVSCCVFLFTRQASKKQPGEIVFFLFKHFFSLFFSFSFLFPPFHSSYSSFTLHRRWIFPIWSPRLQPHHLLNIRRW